MAYSDLRFAYEAGLVTHARGPFDLLVGPPGSGKSSKGHELVKFINEKTKGQVKFWSFNLSRMSPLEFGFILIPDGKGSLVRKLPPHFELPQYGDIVEWTEFGRSHPQIQAAFVDIMSSGELDGVTLPWVFNYATSNDRVFRSSAMKDRFKVSIAPDPRYDRVEAELIKNLIIHHCGLHPNLVGTPSLTKVVDWIIGPTYNGFGIADSGAEVPAAEYVGWSTRHTIGRIKQRAITGSEFEQEMFSLMHVNNSLALSSHPEYFIVLPNDPMNERYLKVFPDVFSAIDSYPAQVQHNITLNRLYLERQLERMQ